MFKIIAVMLGGAVGTALRYFVSLGIYAFVKPTFPYATFFINVTGSFVIGLLAELFNTRVLESPVLRVALLTGVLGGYTTFSSYSWESFSLIRDGEAWLALLNAAGSVVLGLVAVWLGARLAQSF